MVVSGRSGCRRNCGRSEHLMHDPPGSRKRALEAYKNELLANALKLDPITDLLGKADYYINGRRVGNIIYDIESNLVSTDFSSYGAPDLVGGGGKILKGFKVVKKFGYQHGQKVYKYGNRYFSRDIDMHNRGVWKVFKMWVRG